MAKLLQELFEQWAKESCVECLSIGGGGSARRYYRLRGLSRTCIGTIADDVRENEAFFSYANTLRAGGCSVPEVYAIATDRCHYLQEDFGDTSLYSVLVDKGRSGRGFDSEMMTLYRKALSDLDAIQRAGRLADFSKGYPRAAFDRRAMLWDLSYFKYYFLKLAHIPFDEERLQDDFEAFVDWLLQADCDYFMYRDFQGRNIMVDGDRLCYIDFQGGRRGAAQYDVASLLYSAKSNLPEAVRNELLSHYLSVHRDPHFMDYYWGYVLIRIMQTLGAYGYRGLYERKPYFIESIPLAVANLRRVVENHEVGVAVPELRRVWETIARADSTVSPATDGLVVSVQSFSYKRGLPEDSSGNGGGYVFDCRALPNPGRYEKYRVYTGMDRPVIDFLRAEPAVGLFIDHAEALVAQSVEKYVERRFSHLSVAFGCTGGQHRSVYCAEQLAVRMRHRFPNVKVELRHREQS